MFEAVRFQNELVICLDNKSISSIEFRAFTPGQPGLIALNADFEKQKQNNSFKRLNGIAVL